MAFTNGQPVIGDKIYVDFGDSAIDGGEMVGWVSYIASDVIIMCDSRGRVTDSFDPASALFIEIMED